MHPLGITTKFFSLGMFLAAIVALVAFNMPRPTPSPASQIIAAAVAVTAPAPQQAMDMMEEERNDCAVLTIGTVAITDRELRLPPREKLSLPIYPGCENEADYEARVTCGLGRFSAFIGYNRNEPTGSARERVIIRTTITANGKMEGAEVTRGEDERNRTEALRIINLLIERDVRWTPGTVKGVPRDLPLAIPISFHGAGCGE